MKLERWDWAKVIGAAVIGCRILDFALSQGVGAVQAAMK